MRLLEDELTALHTAIAAFDERTAQVRGWCVTVVSGLMALALTQHQVDLALTASGVIFVFWWIDSHAASIQRVLIRRLQVIEQHFRGQDPLSAVRDPGLQLPGMSAGFINPPHVSGWLGEFRFELSETWSEARSPYRALFYALTLVVVAALSLGALG